nr:hypothetical protein [Tanacetum cinerariifolium]
MVGSLVDEIAEPIVEAKEQVIASVIDMDEDIAMLFGDDDLEDDDSKGFDEEGEVWEVNEERLMAPVSDDKVADGITIWEIGPRVFAIEGQVQVMVSQMVQPEDDLEQTMVSEMSSWESTLMHCIPGMDRRLANLERRPPGPQ